MKTKLKWIKQNMSEAMKNEFGENGYNAVDGKSEIFVGKSIWKNNPTYNMCIIRNNRIRYIKFDIDETDGIYDLEKAVEVGEKKYFKWLENL